jgi:hypothetical protein
VFQLSNLFCFHIFLEKKKTHRNRISKSDKNEHNRGKKRMCHSIINAPTGGSVTESTHGFSSFSSVLANLAL